MLLNDLIYLLNNELSSSQISDYCPNGLQVEGHEYVHKIVVGVTASLALIEKAVEQNADAILVHHGYFWKGESYPVVGMKKHRLKLLLEHDISLIAYHLPIDIHPVLGNNAQLGKLLGLQNIDSLRSIKPEGIVMYGQLPKVLSHEELKMKLTSSLHNDVVSVGNKKQIHTVAWCTGGGQNFIDDVATTVTQHKIDAFITGEISEQTTHSAREQNIDFFAAGHHASERYGVKALGEWLQTNHKITVEFIDIDNPA